MKNKQLHLSKTQLYRICIVIIPIIFLYMISSIVFNNITQIKRDVQINISRLETARKDNIKYILNNRIHQAELQNQFIIKSIKNDLSYKDKRMLINDINSGNISEESSRILANTIVYDMKITNFFNTKSPDHILFISNKDGIITINDIDTMNPRVVLKEWSVIIDNKVNTQLTENAIFNLLQNNHNFIYWESDAATCSSFISKYNSSSKEDFYNIIDYMKTEGLINYNILVPIYINLYDDNNKSYNFIIVREINAYYALKPFIYDINKYNFIIDEYKYNMNTLSFITLFIGIVILLLLLGCMILGVIYGNSLYYNKSHQMDGEK